MELAGLEQMDVALDRVGADVAAQGDVGGAELRAAVV